MNGSDLQFAPWLGVALVLFMVYLRLRRQFGRQLMRPVRMGVRMALLLVVGVLLAPMAFSSARLSLIALAALAAGAALGAWAGAHTRLEQSEGRVYYVPHAYAGMAVSVLLVARLGARLAHLGPGAAASAGMSANAQLANSLQNPVNLALLFVLVGYYVSYNGWLLWKAQKLGLAARPAPSSQG